MTPMMNKLPAVWNPCLSHCPQVGGKRHENRSGSLRSTGTCCNILVICMTCVSWRVACPCPELLICISKRYLVQNRFHPIQPLGNGIPVGRPSLFALVSHTVILDSEFGMVSACGWLGWLTIAGWLLIFDLVELEWQHLSPCLLAEW